MTLGIRAYARSGLTSAQTLAVHNFSTHLAMDSFLHAKSRIPIPHSSLPPPHPILSLPSSFTPSTHPSFGSCLTSHQKMLHILHLTTVTFCTLPLLPLQTSPSPHLHLQLCCTHLSFVSILLIFFLLMITPTLLASNPPLTSYFNTHSLAGSATPLPTSWSLPSTHNSSACTSPPHLTCLSSYPTSHHPIQGLQDITPSSGSRHFTFPFSDSASLFTSLSFLIVITLCQNSIHLVLYSFPLQREQPHLNLYGCLRM